MTLEIKDEPSAEAVTAFKTGVDLVSFSTLTMGKGGLRGTTDDSFIVSNVMTLATREVPSAGAVTAFTIDGLEDDCAISLATVVMAEGDLRGGVRVAIGVSAHPMRTKKAYVRKGRGVEGEWDEREGV